MQLIIQSNKTKVESSKVILEVCCLPSIIDQWDAGIFSVKGEAILYFNSMCSIWLR